MNFDAVIIGGGPAGITAGIYLARAGKKAALVEGGMFGGQVATTSLVENYPGTGAIEGSELSLRMLEDLKRTNVHVINENADAVDFSKEDKVVETKSYRLIAKTVILAMGVRPRQINEDLENKFRGRGVSYCATCDGALYKHKDVMVIGGGNSAFIDAKYLSGIARNVYLVHRTDRFRVGDNVVKETEKLGVKIITYNVLSDIVGDKIVEEVVLTNTQTGKQTKVKVNGLFISAGRVPNTELVAGKLPLDENGFIESADCKTNIEGVYACGDIRTKPLRQIVTATSDGAVCSALAVLYLSKR
ncbi:MAG: FAD-dependent oxidoreductase [Clostridia bacterium]|nr:FAD-dependent oxidoreductase [Clostridia bacterium]